MDIAREIRELDAMAKDLAAHRDTLYQRGYFKPRYPVPALRTEVQMFPDRVMLFVKHACHWCMYEWLVS